MVKINRALGWLLIGLRRNGIDWTSCVCDPAAGGERRREEMNGDERRGEKRKEKKGQMK